MESTRLASMEQPARSGDLLAPPFPRARPAQVPLPFSSRPLHSAEKVSLPSFPALSVRNRRREPSRDLSTRELSERCCASGEKLPAPPREECQPVRLSL